MILKLAKGTTTPIAFTVTGVVRDVPSNNPKYAPQHKLVGRTPTDPDACIFLAPTTAERQLSRLGLTLDSVIGQTVEFSRPGDYIDVNRPSGAPTNGKQAYSAGPAIPGLDTPPADPAEGKVKEWTRLCALHRKCLEFVLTTEAPMLIDAKVGASPESVSAQTAQLFIAATQAGLHR